MTAPFCDGRKKVFKCVIHFDVLVLGDLFLYVGEVIFRGDFFPGKPTLAQSKLVFMHLSAAKVGLSSTKLNRMACLPQHHVWEAAVTAVLESRTQCHCTRASPAQQRAMSGVGKS